MPKIRIKLKSDRFFNKAYLPIFSVKSRYQILFGGSSSGKSHSIAQRLVLDLMAGGRNYLCTRNTGNTLRTSSFNEVLKKIKRFGFDQFFKTNQSDMLVTCVNGYQAIFKGLDDPEKIKSITPSQGVITDIWVEEATEISEDAFKQLDKRLRGITDGLKKRITMSFNPILRSHWIYKRFFSTWSDNTTMRNDEDVFILKTTYKDNKFLEPDDIKALENEPDEYMYQVYTLGNWGVLGGVIFPRIEIADILNSDIYQTFDMVRHGMDFGFTNDPTAFNSMYYHRATKTLYIFREWNNRGCTNDVIATALKPYCVDSDCVVCDSAEPKSVAELNNHGLNAKGAAKGKDSVKHGIQWLQQQRIVIDERCQHTINDFSGYHWKKDRTGESVNIPSDNFSHHPDAVRYACEDLVFEVPAGIVHAAQSQVYAAERSYQEMI